MLGLSTLPCELRAMICENLRGDRRTLKALSLACRPFVGLCQAHLFRAVSFHAFPHSDKTLNAICNGFYNLLSTSRDIARHVRHVYIKLHPKDTWYTEDRKFLDILRWLSRLSKLEVDADFDQPFNWELLGEEMGEAFEDIFKRPALRSVKINGIYNLPAMSLVPILRSLLVMVP
ncbi:hypothetical protein BDN72DRAFT_903298 [Pluteus cervinus]|uniref:Uncharacterized protein n=1 Tax=Pluteus cervinus TaxID=181527 RepID=A0ACD3AAA7_9AGAR|nr:hypothetical protein BDN72DRAFT_903298 [Pluteus cervinus]